MIYLHMRITVCYYSYGILKTRTLVMVMVIIVMMITTMEELNAAESDTCHIHVL